MSYDPHDLTVRVQVLAGVWETLGTGRYAGVIPESVRFSKNAWGPDTCSFILRRDPGALHLDLATWTPIEVEVAGELAWDGRIKETPTQEGADALITVTAEGWQYHLDDDVYERKYVHTRLGDWKDTRTVSPLVPLADWTATGLVSSDGAITIGWAADSTIPTTSAVGVTLDLGPGSTAKRVVVDVTTLNLAATNLSLFVRGHDNLSDSAFFSSGSHFEDVVSAATPASGIYAGTFGTARRYVSIFMFFSSTTAAAAVDRLIRIKSVQVFADTAYESGNASILKADQIIKDALSRTAFLTDTSGIQAGTFSIPEYAPDGARTIREALEAANAYENYDLRVKLGRRVIFQPRPTAPVYEIGEWSGADFQDASANSGEEIYNRVLVQGTGPDGAPLTAQRTSGQVAPLSSFIPITTPSNPNPSFDTSTTGWTVSATAGASGSITRDTGVFDSSPASGRLDFSIPGPGPQHVVALSPAFAGAFVAGNTYALTVVLRVASGASLAEFVFGVGVGATPTDFVAGNFAMGVGAFVAATLIWTPSNTYDGSLVKTQIGGTNVLFNNSAQTPVSPIYIDSMFLMVAKPTLIDRRRFVRTKILPATQTAITQAVGNRVGDLYLAGHRTTPFRGGFQAVGQGGIRRVLGGATVHPAHLDTGELARCVHRDDPDTGGWGRDGRIATVQYDHDTLTGTGALDDDRTGFETLLSRYAVVAGQRV
jgi:hypothetical protein